MRISDWSSDVCSSDVEQDIIALRHLVPLDDVVGVDRADAGDDLLIFDRLAARLVDLAEADRGARFGRGVDFNGDRHQREPDRSEEHTSELQSLMRISYAVFCLNKKNKNTAQQ